MKSPLLAVCLKLKKAHQEYMKENKECISFCRFLKILQYSKKDVSLIIETLSDNK